ncbi:MAG TPA: Ig-like domain repeat protein [Solirubrobacterales bacterium]|nr:Ig-like domain repeat protein [Solirubrobacterales bacterium]
MSGTRGGLGRIVAMGIALALALLLLAAREATAGKYSVAQCGWHLDADASWADTTGGAKFRPDAWCATPAGADPFDGAHMKSFTKGGSTVSGTRFARWRWVAPPGTGITRVSGTWWHTLHDGMEQRIGVGTASGGFDPFLSAGGTDVTPHDFVAGFSTPQPALEDRLLCARAESSWCSVESDSWSAVRALTITVEDDGGPGAWIGGELTAGGWRHGSQGVAFSGNDDGGGVRFGETLLDGNRVALAEYPCAMANISGEWRGAKMQPCLTGVSGGATIDTTRFSDGNHSLRHCTTDFAGNVGCTGDQAVGIDNNPPAHARNLTLAGGDGWRRVDNFDFSWANPDQGPASPIWGAYWRITGPAGYDTGVNLAPGRDIVAIADRTLPRVGVYAFQIWLRDEAGNANAASAIEMPMRLDDVPPGVAFEALPETTGPDLPQTVSAEVSDGNSGLAGGEIQYRRLNGERWDELPTKLQPGEGPGSARLVAAVPEGLSPGTYVFQAEAVDVAGNTTSTTRRVDGTEMALRKTPPPVAPSRPAAASEVAPPAPRAKTRLFAKLRWHHRHGSQVTVPFGAGAALSGRLLSADGAGLAGRRLRVVSRPSRGALAPSRVDAVETGPHGGFKLALVAGPSRRITVSYDGESGLAAARRPALALRVRGAAILHAAPRALHTGQAVRLWGRVRARGAPLPRRGKLVAIQYYESEARCWRPVLVTRSDHSGRFRARYRFRYITGTAMIRLRAVALAEERWPYAPGVSRPVVIRVSDRSR